MKNLKTFLLIGCLFCLGASLAFNANATAWNEKTHLSFDQPFELPGGIVLPAGTYVFKLVGSLADRNLVQVLSPDGRNLYATVHTIPKYRSKTTERNLVIFEEKTASGGPRSLKEWFYPNYTFGHEFVYSKTEPLQLSKADEPERDYKTEFTQRQSAEVPASNESDSWTEPHESIAQSEERQMEKSGLSIADESEGANQQADHGDLSYMQALHQKQTDEQQKAPNSDQVAMLRELPRTASQLPLVFLSGFFLMAVGFGLRFCSKRID
jgi:hypothetical protein